MSEASRAPAPSHATLPRLAEPSATVLEHLVRRFPHVGENAWRTRLASGTVTFDDGERVTAETPYRAGARVRYFRAVAREPAVPFAEEILYRDERILVADKPHFLPVTPGGPYVNECLTYRLRRRTGLDALQAVHRLDRDTAGLVLCAVSADVRGLYAQLFMEGCVEKEYLAVAKVPDEPGRRTWEVANRIVRGEPWFRMRIVPGPVNARTRIELVEWRDGLGLFRLVPSTGKKHQLRLHLASLGYPVVGDRYYPELLPEAPPDYGRPLRLVASRLEFRDSVSGRMLRFRSLLGLPDEPWRQKASVSPRPQSSPAALR